MAMKELMQNIRDSALRAILETADVEKLEAERVRYLGKKGELTAILRQMGSLSAEERPVMGQLANQVRAEIEKSIEERREELSKRMLALKLESEAVDVTLPGKTAALGHKHPMYNALDQIKDIFIALGFTIVDGPEVELSDYNVRDRTPIAYGDACELGNGAEVVVQELLVDRRVLVVEARVGLERDEDDWALQLAHERREGGARRVSHHVDEEEVEVGGLHRGDHRGGLLRIVRDAE